MKAFILIISIASGNLLFCQSKQEISEEYSQEFRKAKDELKTVYEKILAKYASDTIFVDAAKKSQATWLKFRDAELTMKFPVKQPMVPSGDNCPTRYLIKLTRERIKRLSTWLTSTTEQGEEECNGSVKAHN